MTNVGMDIFARLLQMSLLVVANQSSTKLNCCFKVLGVTISLDSVHYFHWFVKKQGLYLLLFFFAIIIRFFGRNRVDTHEKA